MIFINQLLIFIIITKLKEKINMIDKISNLFKNNNDLVLAFGIIIILFILFVPIPTSLSDMLIIVNFSLALMILLLTFYTVRPVEFSMLPSLLLVTTLFRLSLNVAATRLILTDGYAGDVIDAIGTFVVQGNYIIGLVVFFILVVVQYVVVTAGAQRVSEVAARFVLDAVPGQQMSIDADLNMGLIDQTEASRRRQQLEKEASFYGAMDGASKFVKGDAVAGIIILLVNIIAGWIIGVAQMGLDWYDALQRFTLLTIGDGIVTQVPALIISVATGIIVTRSAQDRQLSTEVISQLTSVPKILFIVMGVLCVFLVLPGMPKWPVIMLISVFAGFTYILRRNVKRNAKLGMSALDVDEAASADQARLPVIGVLLGLELGLAWAPLKPVLAERITALRKDRADKTGLIIPPVKIIDGLALPVNAYEIQIFGSRHGKGEIFATQTLAIKSNELVTSLEGVEVLDPAFGLPAVWIDQSDCDGARAAGHTLVDPLTVLITHLGEILRSEAPLLLTRSATLHMLEGVRERQAGVVEELVPNIMTVSDVQRVLQNLLAEDVPIRGIDQIVESLVDVGRQTKDHADLTELIRQRLSHVICHGLRGDNEVLSVLSLDPRIEAVITDSVGRVEPNVSLILDPKLAEQLMRKTIPHVESMLRQELIPVMLCGSSIRRYLRTFLRRSIPRLAVISVNEVPSSVNLKSFAVVSLDL